MNDGDFLTFIAAGELAVEEEGWEKNKWADRDVKKTGQLCKSVDEIIVPFFPDTYCCSFAIYFCFG